MLTYYRASGILDDNDGNVLGQGYSGLGPAKNNPAMSDVPDQGPIPAGLYTLGTAFNSPTHGPLAIPLTPNPQNQMYGRSSFLIHGDSLQHPGSASLGCIIMPHDTRVAIINGGDTALTVV